MDASNAMRTCVIESGLTHKQIESKARRYGGWLGQTLARPRPGADLLAEVAHACGYRLALVPDGDGETIVIGEDFEPTDSGMDDKVQQARSLLARACALLDDGR